MSVRIGKIKMKNGGAEVRVLPETKTFHCHESAVNLRKNIDENTQAVSFTVLRKDGTVLTGFSYESGTALSSMVGAADILKTELYDHWLND